MPDHVGPCHGGRSAAAAGSFTVPEPRSMIIPDVTGEAALGQRVYAAR
ncbi:hypothetical protein [Frigidibacter sp. MR17.24]